MAGLYTPAIEVPASTPVIETHTAPKASERTGEPAEPRPLLEAHGQAAEPDQTSYAAKESRLKFVFFRNRIRSCNSHELYLAVSKSRGSGTLDTVQRSPPPGVHGCTVCIPALRLRHRRSRSCPYGSEGGPVQNK